jgi:hypothetical protein
MAYRLTIRTPKTELTGTYETAALPEKRRSSATFAPVNGELGTEHGERRSNREPAPWLYRPGLYGAPSVASDPPLAFSLRNRFAGGAQAHEIVGDA